MNPPKILRKIDMENWGDVGIGLGLLTFVLLFFGVAYAAFEWYGVAFVAGWFYGTIRSALNRRDAA